MQLQFTKLKKKGMLSFMMLTTFKVWEKTIKNGRKRTSNIICTMLCLEFVTPGLSPEWGRPGDIFQKNEFELYQLIFTMHFKIILFTISILEL